MDLLLYLAGSALIAALVRWWRPEVPLRTAAGYVLLAGLFFAVPLATPALQVPTDIAYTWMPWGGTLPGRIEPANPLLNDIPTQMIPFRELVRRRLLGLEVPLWAHEMGTGQPLLGNAQSAPFAPLHLMALPVPTLRALTLAVAWQILLALLLMYALARALGAGEWGAAFAAVAYAFSTFLIPWAYHPIGMSVAWVPGVLLGLFLLRHGGRGGFAGLVACAAGMALSGHPESVAHMALASLAVAAVLLLSRGEPARRSFLGRLAAAGALTACLTAPVLLPILDAVPESERWAVVKRAPDLVQTLPFRPAFLLPLVDPLVFGSSRDGNWDGPANFNELCSAYAGILALALAAAGALVLRGRVAWILAGGLAALMVALRLPPLFELVSAVPGLEHAAHGRLRLFWILAVALAAGLSLEKLPWRAAVAAALGMGVALLLVPPPPVFWQRLWWGAVLSGLLALAWPRLRPVFPAVALAVLGLDLALLGARFHPVLPPVFDLAPPPALAFLLEKEPPFRVLAETADLLPNLAGYYGLWDPRGNDPMQPAAPATMVGRLLMPRFKTGRLVQLSYRRFPRHLEPRFDYLGVRYLLARHRRRLPRPWRTVFNGAGGRVWENPDPLPLFFLPASVGPGDPLAIRDFRALAVAEAPVSRVRQEGTVAIGVRANGFDLDVETRTGGVIVSSVSHTRSWRLQVDGSEEEVLRVNGGFVGFEVPPGRHRAVLDYRPKGWTRGLWLFALGAVYSALSTSIGRRSRARALAASPAATARNTVPASAAARGQGCSSQTSSKPRVTTM